MIVGLGTDIVSIDRIAKLLTQNGEHFIERICSENEKKYVWQNKETKARVAKLWAVKEAAAKALGTGFAKGVSFEDIELSHDELGKPEIRFLGRAGEILAALTKGGVANVLVSISDDKPFAQAVVIIEKI